MSKFNEKYNLILHSWSCQKKTEFRAVLLFGFWAYFDSEKNLKVSTFCAINLRLDMGCMVARDAICLIVRIIYLSRQISRMSIKSHDFPEFSRFSKFVAIMK